MENKKLPLFKQIIIGIVAAFFEFLMVVVNADFLKLPIYFDCIWTCAASFFSPLSGIICAVCYHFPVIIMYHHGWPSLMFALCSLSVVLCVRIFMNYKKNLPFILSFIISIEGGIISSFLGWEIYRIAVKLLQHKENKNAIYSRSSKIS